MYVLLIKACCKEPEIAIPVIARVSHKTALRCG
jgi:hypothetical protein